MPSGSLDAPQTAVSPAFSRVRSLLFVPGDSARKQAKALACPADALILDLEDSVAPDQLPAARARVCALLAPPRGAQQYWVRVNGPDSGHLLTDLAAVVGAAPTGLVLPKISSCAQLNAVAHYLEALETAAHLAVGSIRLLVIGTETPQGLLALPRYAQALDPGARARLVGLTWGMEDLGTALGARSPRDETGQLTGAFQLARTTCLVAAASLEVSAIDGVYSRFKDKEGLVRELAQARRDGFTAKLAIHPDQVEPINAAFTPTAAELERARAVVAAFATGSGVASLDGQMLDRPHLLQAQRLLASAGEML